MNDVLRRRKDSNLSQPNLSSPNLHRSGAPLFANRHGGLSGLFITHELLYGHCAPACSDVNACHALILTVAVSVHRGNLVCFVPQKCQRTHTIAFIRGYCQRSNPSPLGWLMFLRRRSKRRRIICCNLYSWLLRKARPAGCIILNLCRYNRIASLQPVVNCFRFNCLFVICHP